MAFKRCCIVSHSEVSRGGLNLFWDNASVSTCHCPHCWNHHSANFNDSCRNGKKMQQSQIFSFKQWFVWKFFFYITALSEFTKYRLWTSVIVASSFSFISSWINISFRLVTAITGQVQRSLLSSRNLEVPPPSVLECRILLNVTLSVNHNQTLSGERTAVCWITSIIQSNNMLVLFFYAVTLISIDWYISCILVVVMVLSYWWHLSSTSLNWRSTESK